MAAICVPPKRRSLLHNSSNGCHRGKGKVEAEIATTYGKKNDWKTSNDRGREGGFKIPVECTRQQTIKGTPKAPPSSLSSFLQKACGAIDPALSHARRHASLTSMFRTHRCVSNSGHECLDSSRRLRIYRTTPYRIERTAPCGSREATEERDGYSVGTTRVNNRDGGGYVARVCGCVSGEQTPVNLSTLRACYRLEESECGGEVTLRKRRVTQPINVYI